MVTNGRVHHLHYEQKVQVWVSMLFRRGTTTTVQEEEGHSRHWFALPPWLALAYEVYNHSEVRPTRRQVDVGNKNEDISMIMMIKDNIYRIDTLTDMYL